ncbi:hypothetical protein [Methylocystis sp. SB2]|uniref:hypothetical protein n=1 Tax=Methylocystis sp. (strain SB2) TaxID=743836 RepID=UPI0005679963|nr:hypothetical protein [Methylocystis sp. SB2]ULO25102.1 hypothetical protein LNB28_06860 [Methylocystis sp. SB2]
MSEKRFSDPRLAYHLWYEFLRRAKESDNPEVLAAMEASEEFYEAWDLVPYQDFDTWWEKNDMLFEEMDYVRELEPGELPEDNRSLILEIPLYKSPTQLTKEVGAIIQAAYQKRGKTGKKDKRTSRALFHLSAGSEPKLGVLVNILAIYDIWRFNKMLSSEELLEEIQKHFLSGYPNKQLSEIPAPFRPRKNVDIVGDKLRMLKNVREYRDRGEKIVLNVANGLFPGE